MKRIIKHSEYNEWLNNKVDVKSESIIEYRFVISINSKLIDIFNAHFDKFSKDDISYSEYDPNPHGYDQSPKYQKYMTYTSGDNGGKIYKIYLNTHLNDVLYSPVIHKTSEVKLINDIEYTKLTFNFKSTPIYIIKTCIDITDLIEFINLIYEYDSDGLETIKVKYPIGSIVNILTEGEHNFMVDSYHFGRNKKIITYNLTQIDINYNKYGSKFNCIKESNLKPSRWNNLNILLN